VVHVSKSCFVVFLVKMILMNHSISVLFRVFLILYCIIYHGNIALVFDSPLANVILKPKNVIYFECITNVLYVHI